MVFCLGINNEWQILFHARYLYTMLQFLNYFFFAFHTIFTIFNLVGWVWRSTRKLHLITMLLTVFSWFILGIWYGWGYCLCTDWHWDIRESLGYTDRSNSYIHFLILKLTGIDMDQVVVEMATMIIFLVLLIITIILNWRDRQVSALNKRMDKARYYEAPRRRRED
jgi:hypothetical protein